MANYRRIQVERFGEVAVVRFADPCLIDEWEISEFGRELYALVEVEKSAKLVIDFSEVNRFSSGVLGKLISLGGKARAQKGAVVLCSIPPAIQEIFHICSLDKVFAIKATRVEALAAF